MKHFTLLIMFVALASTIQTQGQCIDNWNEYVDSKNVGATGAYTLKGADKEFAAQTYDYQGPGKLMMVRVYGSSLGWNIPFKLRVYEADANNRPATLQKTINYTWGFWDLMNGYKDIYLGSASVYPGIYTLGKFALAIEMQSSSTFTQFYLKYTGDGEGNGEDLASLAGTSTGFNWSSAKDNFGKDGDFYIVPTMQEFVNSDFSASNTCAVVNSTIAFTNSSQVSTDMMFNTIMSSGYSGSNAVYSWDFGDGTTSTAMSPNHSYSTSGEKIVTLTVTYEGWNTTCTDVYTKNISVGLSPSTTATNVTCNGGDDGIINTAVSGGALPYQYRINNGQWVVSGTFSNLSAGTYTVDVMDNLSCQNSSTITITEPSAILFSSISTTNASCGTNDDGSILVTVTGGTGQLLYSIDNVNWATSGLFEDLVMAGYTVYVKDQNNCVVSTTVDVNSIQGPTLSLVSYSNVSCNNDNDGLIQIQGSGGSGALVYSIDDVNYQSNGIFSGLTAGAYHITVKDVAQCKSGFWQIITEPSEIQFVATSGNVSCNSGSDGTVEVSSAIGGTGSLSYSIDGSFYQSTPIFYGLAATSYTVYVKDIANCMVSMQVVVDEPLPITSTVSTVDATCYDYGTGRITVVANGGYGRHHYSIDNGVHWQPSGVFSGMSKGAYVVVVEDQNNCQISVNATINEPTKITSTIVTSNSTCGSANGAILATAAGGTNSFLYSLDGGTWNTTGQFTNLVDSTYSVIVKDQTNCYDVFQAIVVDSDGPTVTGATSTDVTCNGGNDGTMTITSVTGGTGTLQYKVDNSAWQLSNVFTGLTGGSHTAVVKDQNSCSGDTTITLAEPNAIVVTTSVTDVTCYNGNNGSVVITSAGGQGTLAYSLDAFNYQGSNVFSNLDARIYIVTVKDAGQCTSQSLFTIDQPTEIISNLTVSGVTCSAAGNGSILVNASGGTGSLTYSIDGSNYQSGYVFTGLDGGPYLVYVKDASNCTRMFYTYLAEPEEISLGVEISDVNCAGGDDGVVNLNLSGGTPPFTFAWSTGATTEDIFNLSAGMYSVSSTDVNGCAATGSYTVTEPNDPVIVNGVVDYATGQTNSDGMIDITVTGGTQPYTFDWSNGATVEDITGLTPGLYTVEVLDNLGCQTSLSFAVSYTVDIQETIDGDLATKIYPNPANDVVNIETSVYAIDEIKLFNILGQMVYMSKPKAKTATIATADHAKGLYIVQVKINSVTETKLIKIVR